MYLSTLLIIRANCSRFPRLHKMRREWAHLHTPLQKPVLLRLRLAASEKPVLNAPASACVAEIRKGGERWNRQCGAKSSCPVPLTALLPTASTAASAGIWSTPPHGKERETCEKVRRIIPHELMQDAFVMQKEFWFKRDGSWSLQTKPMYKEYFFVATRDAAALDKALAQLSFVCRIAGSRERAYAPMPDDAQDWYRSVLDDEGVVRNSVARIEHGVLHIEQGPLVGQEARVKKIDRHKRWCLVDVGEGDSAFRELLPLDVPSKT